MFRAVFIVREKGSDAFERYRRKASLFENFDANVTRDEMTQQNEFCLCNVPNEVLSFMFRNQY